MNNTYEPKEKIRMPEKMATFLAGIGFTEKYFHSMELSLNKTQAHQPTYSRSCIIIYSYLDRRIRIDSGHVYDLAKPMILICKKILLLQKCLMSSL